MKEIHMVVSLFLFLGFWLALFFALNFVGNDSNDLLFPSEEIARLPIPPSGLDIIKHHTQN